MSLRGLTYGNFSFHADHLIHIVLPHISRKTDFRTTVEPFAGVPGKAALVCPKSVIKLTPKACVQPLKLTLRKSVKFRRRFIRNLMPDPIITARENLASVQSATDETNKRNNRLNQAASFNIQNYGTPSVFRVSSDTNALLLRSALPFRGVPQIFRPTVAIGTRPDSTGPLDQTAIKPGRANQLSATRIGSSNIRSLVHGGASSNSLPLQV